MSIKLHGKSAYITQTIYAEKAQEQITLYIVSAEQPCKKNDFELTIREKEA